MMIGLILFSRLMEGGQMGNIIIKSGTRLLLKGGKVVLNQIAPDAFNFGAKIGNEFMDHQKNLVKIPNLKDVHIAEALRVLSDELNLTATSAIAKPSLRYANESENEVMYSEPRFGSRVNPRTMVKVYYLTQEVIDKSKELLEIKVQEFKVPGVIGLNIHEAREDLEDLGLKVTEKLEKPSLRFVDKEAGQVTRTTNSNNRKIDSKIKTGNRVLLYYVNEEVILESKAIKDKKEKNRQVIIDKIGKTTKDISKGIYNGAVETPKNIVKNIKKPFKKKRGTL